jgi:hypothetical protein
MEHLMTRIVSAFLVSFVLMGLIACGGGSSTPPPPPVPLNVSPASASVNIGSSQPFSVTNTTSPVSWSVNGPGSISPTGVYLAPSTFPSPNTVTITASAGNQSGTASVTVVFPNDNSGNQSVPVKLGTSGGNILDNSTDGKSCCIGTLGSLWDIGGTKFILSNNHVLARSSLGKDGEAIDQPGEPRCPAGSQGLTVANLSMSQQAPLKPTTTFTTTPCDKAPSPCGFAPKNVDAAVAQIVPTTVDTSGAILDLGAAGATSIGAAAPSSTLGDPATVLAANGKVAKSGRTTGLTCSTLAAINITTTVPYDASCGAADSAPGGFTAAFKNQIAVNGGTFSAGGDSGSLIVTADTARPLGLLYAGSPANTFANPISDVIRAFTQAGPPAVVPTIVGGPDHPVSCEPTSQAQASVQPAAQFASLSSDQRRVTLTARDHNRVALMSSDPAIQSVEAGVSLDNPAEGALLIQMGAPAKNRIPAVVDGVRTKLIYDQGVAAPAMTKADVERTAIIKEAHENAIFGPGIQGVGVGRSDDAPGETAIVIFTIKGESHAPIPAVIGGVRTKVIESGRIRSTHWNPQLEPKTGACSKAPQKVQLKAKLK